MQISRLEGDLQRSEAARAATIRSTTETGTFRNSGGGPETPHDAEREKELSRLRRDNEELQRKIRDCAQKISLLESDKVSFVGY